MHCGRCVGRGHAASFLCSLEWPAQWYMSSCMSFHDAILYNRVTGLRPHQHHDWTLRLRVSVRRSLWG